MKRIALLSRRRFGHTLLPSHSNTLSLDDPPSAHFTTTLRFVTLHIRIYNTIPNYNHNVLYTFILISKIYYNIKIIIYST